MSPLPSSQRTSLATRCTSWCSISPRTTGSRKARRSRAQSPRPGHACMAPPPDSAFDPELSAVLPRLSEALPEAVGRHPTAWDTLVDVCDCTANGEGETPGVPVRLYECTDRARPSAAVIYLHGGGFMMGDLDDEHPRAVRLAAEAGCLVVSVDYRL